MTAMKSNAHWGPSGWNWDWDWDWDGGNYNGRQERREGGWFN
jgi:hypothetical protein